MDEVGQHRQNGRAETEVDPTAELEGEIELGLGWVGFEKRRIEVSEAELNRVERMNKCAGNDARESK